MLIKLNHSCSHPKCAGEPGDVIDVSDEIAQYLLDRKGGTLVEAPAAKSDAPKTKK